MGTAPTSESKVMVQFAEVPLKVFASTVTSPTALIYNNMWIYNRDENKKTTEQVDS